MNNILAGWRSIQKSVLILDFLSPRIYISISRVLIVNEVQSLQYLLRNLANII